jgi:hypothetical protein
MKLYHSLKDSYAGTYVHSLLYRYFASRIYILSLCNSVFVVVSWNIPGHYTALQLHNIIQFCNLFHHGTVAWLLITQKLPYIVEWCSLSFPFFSTPSSAFLTTHYIYLFKVTFIHRRIFQFCFFFCFADYHVWTWNFTWWEAAVLLWCM